ncbi:MAG TPA: hypothetical protein GXX36_14830 [Clostridiaceae bacterium]|nr:hypothetical protein [Clostridiaceae bacterium]
MRFIHWKDFMQDGTITLVSSLPKDSTSWVDPVSGTGFFLRNDEYSALYSEIQIQVRELSVSYITDYLDKPGFQSTLPYIVDGKNRICTVRDVARLFVLFAYLYEGKQAKDKNKLRQSAYKAFFAEDKNVHAEAWNALELLLNPEGTLKSKLNVRVLKGGAYKIKKYYLETNGLKDMRGASKLLSYVSEKHIPGIISNLFIPECIIYAGGGNILCVLPEWADESLIFELEDEFHKYTLSLQNAFCMVDVVLDRLLGNYKEAMAAVQERLDERKKLKIYNDTCPASPFWDIREITIDGNRIAIDASELNHPGTCRQCRVREAIYRLNTGSGEVVCGSCLHKNLVGKSTKQEYVDNFEKYTGRKVDIAAENLSDIKDENKYIAVIYGDGNNMGGIVQNINSLSDMMYFSRKISMAAQNSVYKALEQTNFSQFEIIAVGGDDIFLIVPARGSIEFCARLIELFNEEFRNMSASEGECRYRATLSVGLCIGKYRSPVRLMQEYAEKALENAKLTARKSMLQGTDNGSMDFVILEGLGAEIAGMSAGKNETEVLHTLRPYTLDRIKAMMALVNSMKAKGSGVRKTSLYQMENAAENADAAEARLFYSYNQARHKNRLEKLFKANNIRGLEWDSGFYVDKLNSILISPWRDILDIWDFGGGDEVDRNIEKRV